LNFLLGLVVGWSSAGVAALVALVFTLRHMRHVELEKLKLRAAADRLAGVGGRS